MKQIRKQPSLYQVGGKSDPGRFYTVAYILKKLKNREEGGINLKTAMFISGGRSDPGRFYTVS